MSTGLKMLGLLVLLAVAFAGFLLVASGGVGAADSSADFTIDEPGNQSVEVDVLFNDTGTVSGTPQATVNLIGSGGTVAESVTINGSAGNVTTAELPTDSLLSGDFSVNASSSTTNVSVSINETRIVTTRTVEILDPENETLIVDTGLSGTDDGRVDITVTNETGATVMTDSLDYDASAESGSAVITGEYNGTEAGFATLTVEVAVTPPYLLETPPTAQVTTASSDDGLFAGGVGGEDSGTALLAVIVIGGGIYYARREEYI